MTITAKNIQLSVLLCGGIFLFVQQHALAQNRATQQNDSIIQGQTIQINQIYQPEVKQPQKPALIPVLPPPDTSKPKFQYVVPQQTLSYTYHSIPIRPLALGKQSTEDPFQNYAKAGIGNLTSIYLDAGIGSLKGDDYQTAFHIHHLSQKGKLPDQQSGTTEFLGSGDYYAAGHDFRASIQVRNRRHRFYGYDNALYDYGSSAIQQSLTDGSVTVAAKNIEQNRLGIDYQPEIGFGLFGDNFSARESRFTFNLPAQWHFGQLPTDSIPYTPYGKISLGLYGNLVNFKTAGSSNGNNLIKVNPAVDVTIENVRLHAGLSPAFGRNSQFWLLPDLSATAGLLNNHLTAFAGWKSDVNQNTYLDLSLVNPFIDNIFDLQQSKTDQAFVGINSTAGKFITFGATLSWRQWKDMPLFINDYMGNPDGKRFQVIYSPKVQAFNVEAFVRYQPSEFIALSAQGSWYNFYKTTVDEAWGYPTLKMEGLLEVHPVTALQAHAGFSLLKGVATLDDLGDTHVLSTIFDLNAAAEYNIIPRFSVFLQANNILNQKYQRWNQYQAYGLNIIGGFRFKF